MHDNNIQRAAEILADAWCERATLPGLPADCQPQTRAAAYAIQDAMAERLGFEVVGWKVGAASKGQLMAEQLDGPIVGRILAPTLIISPAQLSAAQFPAGMLECEFAFQLQQTLQPRSEPYNTAELSELIDLCLSLELTGSRFDQDHRDHFFSNMADNGNSGALIVSPAITGWQSLDLPAMHVDLRINQGSPIVNLTGDWRVDPLQVMVWTVNSLLGRGITLAAKTIISTGSSTEPQPFGSGDHAIAVYEGLGELVLRLG